MGEQIWTTEEIDQFLEGAKDERLYLAFVIMIFGGLRRGETLGLKWKNVDLDNGYIYVREAQTKGYVERIEIGDTKTKNSIRDIKISKRVIDELKKLKEERKEEKKKMGQEWSVDDLVIVNNVGRVQEPRKLQTVKDRVVEKLGMKNIRIHDIRHTHASLMLENNISVKRVQERLGHSRSSTTMDTYSHSIPREEDDIADQFEKLF